MKHIKALGIKWIIIGIVTFSLFGIFHNVSLVSLFWMSIIVTATSYVLGDLLLLPRIGNLFTTVADFGLLFILFALLGNILFQTTFPITLAALAASFFISCTEPLFHAYLEEKIFPGEHATFSVQQLQTEIAEESDPDIRSEYKEKNKIEE